jgi:hypothetical protein
MLQWLYDVVSAALQPNASDEERREAARQLSEWRHRKAAP